MSEKTRYTITLLTKAKSYDDCSLLCVILEVENYKYVSCTLPDFIYIFKVTDFCKQTLADCICGFVKSNTECGQLNLTIIGHKKGKISFSGFLKKLGI